MNGGGGGVQQVDRVRKGREKKGREKKGREGKGRAAGLKSVAKDAVECSLAKLHVWIETQH